MESLSNRIIQIADREPQSSSLNWPSQLHYRPQNPTAARREGLPALGTPRPPPRHGGLSLPHPRAGGLRLPLAGPNRPSGSGTAATRASPTRAGRPSAAMAVRLEPLRCLSSRLSSRELRPAGCGRALPSEKGHTRQARGCEADAVTEKPRLPMAAASEPQTVQLCVSAFFPAGGRGWEDAACAPVL